MLTSSVYPFITKDGSLSSFKTIDTDSFNGDFLYGDIISGSNYPLTATISSEFFIAGSPTPLQPKLHLLALKNTLNYYKYLSPYHEYNSVYGNKEILPLRLLSIPSIFYGKNIKKGTVSCKWYLEGSLLAELRDIKRNGELIEIYGPNSGSTAGIVLYSEGFMILTGSWDINPPVFVFSEESEQVVSDQEEFLITEQSTEELSRIYSWLDYMITGTTDPFLNISSSFDLTFDGVEEIPTVTMFAHAERGEFNYSNNPTFIEYDQKSLKLTGSSIFLENDDAEIKNITFAKYEQVEPQFEKTTFISSVGIYDDMGNLIATAKLATPVRKREIDSISFKLKLDI